VSEAALLYHAEAEWAGQRMPCEIPARILEENQIGFDIIPSDVFAEPERFNGEIGTGLRVNTQVYKALIIPQSQFITKAIAEAAVKLNDSGFPVFFIGSLPEGVCEGGKIPDGISGCPVLQLEQLTAALRDKNIGEVKAEKPSPFLRCLHTLGACESYYFVNEAAEVFVGSVTVPTFGPCYAYNAWDNRLETIDAISEGGKTRLSFSLESRKSLIVVFGEPPAPLNVPVAESGAELPVSNWTRALCESVEYPSFGPAKPVSLPDKLAEEQPEFSGYARYTATFQTERTEGLVLAVTNASEGVEVFVNGQSAGIQIVPAYRYDISALAKRGLNELTIDVATTLERKCYPLLNARWRAIGKGPDSGSGITGEARLYIKK
jgi:hypothetical protein